MMRSRSAALFRLGLLAACAMRMPVTAAEAPPSGIERTRLWVERWLHAMPDFVCSQVTQQFWANSSRSIWRPHHRFEAEVTVLSGTEHYQLLTVDGNPAGADAPRDLLSSRGEFFSAVRALFDPESHAVFADRGSHNECGLTLSRFAFKVPKAHSQWYVGRDGTYAPAYHGTISYPPLLLRTKEN
jgi:hypothetical protein